MPVNRYIVIGFFLVLIGAVLPFLMVLRMVPSTFFLNFFAFSASVAGLFLGVIGVATHMGVERRKGRDDWRER